MRNIRERNSKIENVMAAIVIAKHNAKIPLTEASCINCVQLRALSKVKRGKK